MGGTVVVAGDGFGGAPKIEEGMDEEEGWEVPKILVSSTEWDILDMLIDVERALNSWGSPRDMQRCGLGLI